MTASTAPTTGWTLWPWTHELAARFAGHVHFYRLAPHQAIVDRTGRYAVVTVRNQPAILVVDLTTYQVVWQVPTCRPTPNREGVARTRPRTSSM